MLDIEDAKVKQSLARRASRGTHKFHMLMMMQTRPVAQMELTIFVEILIGNRIQFGVTLLTH